MLKLYRARGDDLWKGNSVIETIRMRERKKERKK
jgi:hypothetical protein